MADTPKKKPSGHYYRQKRKEKAAIAVRPQPTMLGPGQWQMPSLVPGNVLQDNGAVAIELPLYGQPPAMLVAAVNAALIQLEQGAFYASSYLWDGMKRDDRIAATMQQRIGGLIGAPLELLPADEDSGQATSIKEEAEKLLAKMMPMSQVSELMDHALGLSVGVAQVLTTRTRKSTMPTFEVWNNRNLRYDWSTRDFYIVTQNKGEIRLEREDPEWIVYEPFGPRGWLHGALIRSLAYPWLIRHHTRTWWARYQEVHGQPIRLGILPADRTPEDEKRFLQQLYTIGHEATIRAPQGVDGNRFDLKLIEATANNWQGFKELLAHCDDSIAISILGQRQSTMGQGGLGAQEKAGDATFVRILKRDALVSDVLREKLLMPWVEENHGDPELAPYIKWEIDPEEDQVAKTKALDQLADAVSKFALAPDFARHVDIRSLLDDFGIPLVSEDQVPADIPDEPTSGPVDESSTVSTQVVDGQDDKKQEQDDK